MATTRAEERVACSLGQGSPAPVKVEPSQALYGAGILFLLPALLAHGLLKTKEVYQWSSKVFHWYSGQGKEDADFIYIDGHERIYYGYNANLPVKFVSCQKLCLSATTEYWVNDAQGMPVMMVMGELTEKPQAAIEQLIIPQLRQTNLLSARTEDDQQPFCTFIFDRETYEPAFFHRLWTEHKIAIITYRKNVKDKWSENSFKRFTVSVLQQSVNMYLCEEQTELGGYLFREIRRLGKDGHQTSIITTHPTLEPNLVAGRMFGRWCQNFFFDTLLKIMILTK